MKFKSLWSRHLHQRINPRAFIICGHDIYATERQNYLTKLDISSGEIRWSTRIPLYNSNLYYMT